MRGRVLQHRDFRLLLAAATCNYLGYGGEQVIIGLLAFQITGSSAWVGVAVGLYFLPLLIFGLAAGAISDWIDRRRLLQVTEIAIALNLAVFGLITAGGEPELWSLLLMSFLAGSGRAVYLPVRQSYACDIVGVEQVVSGLGLLSIGMRVGQMLGALMAGAIMHRWGPDAAFYALAASHAATFLIVSRLRSVTTEAHGNPVPIVENIREYVREIRHNRSLLLLILVTAAVEIFGFSFLSVLPELATQRLDVGADGLGMMHAFRAAGGFAASVALAASVRIRRRGLFFLAVIYCFGFSLMALAVAPNYLTILLAVLIVAASATASDVLSQSMMQLSVPDRLRGRAMGAWVFAIGSAPLGHLQMGSLAAFAGVTVALGLNGAALVLVGLITTLAAPRLRKL